MRDLFRTLPLMCVVMLVPVLPFLLFGGWFDDWVTGLRNDPPADGVTAAIVVGLLTTDIALPIPSSVVCTMAGWQLGSLLGTAAAWVGMTLGAVIGFAIARRWGRPVALWFTKADDLQRMQHVSERYGPMVLALCRAVPVFAEASVLIVGIHRLSWRRFLPTVMLSNLGIALAYVLLGEFAQKHGWLPLALGVSIALPVVMAAAARRWVPNENAPLPTASDSTDASDRPNPD